MDLKCYKSATLNGDSLNKLADYRTELMGFTAIMILFCHACPYGVSVPGVWNRILAYENLGIEIFFFLSGIGISFSLSRKGSITHWYYKRFVRIIVPYLAIAIPWYVISAIINHILHRRERFHFGNWL